ncbi:CUE domain containing protein [Trichomonas vaginalis G3]|uniref:CUE domain containing protein n=1 Tax=Trichomonas vaginalis (strain ATCC PRA-98 / G3) TaxID=412133 RepID=A2FNQ7_TRIV3|nr:CUE domain containing protein 1 family [Trichomonas vaginalis G3]EAX93458.1 CUE domain containing protein [Trichomonas vaginalis G3]KAI5532375.1 CUE domain containing protein 1 family [Trichomonas vaginalis G3]|eukprot:XP_001306388.1 CUE domain containing protein [Trichomonas vaginalis G3]
MSSYEAAIEQLSEMFPNHQKSTIASTLRSKNGDLQNTINALLKMKPDKGPKVIEDAQSQHIFPSDFMRWPKDVQYVKVFTDNNSNSLFDDDSQMIPIESSNVPTVADEKTLSVEHFKATNSSTWESFKQKFKQGRSYDQI